MYRVLIETVLSHSFSKSVLFQWRPFTISGQQRIKMLLVIGTMLTNFKKRFWEIYLVNSLLSGEKPILVFKFIMNEIKIVIYWSMLLLSRTLNLSPCNYTSNERYKTIHRSFQWYCRNIQKELLIYLEEYR